MIYYPVPTVPYIPHSKGGWTKRFKTFDKAKRKRKNRISTLSRRKNRT